MEAEGEVELNKLVSDFCLWQEVDLLCHSGPPLLLLLYLADHFRGAEGKCESAEGVEGYTQEDSPPWTCF